MVFEKTGRNWGMPERKTSGGALQRRNETNEPDGLKKMGVNLVLTSFHKGFGGANEKASMDDARAYGKLLHKHGLKMGVLVDMLFCMKSFTPSFPNPRIGTGSCTTEHRTCTTMMGTLTAIPNDWIP